MRAQSFLAAVLVMAIMNVVSEAKIYSVYFDDGQTHSLNDNTYQGIGVWLDKNTFNDPGTHLELLDGAKTGYILPFNKSTITINGGSVDGGNVSIDTHGDNIITVNGGTLKGDIAANNNSRIYANGGTFYDDIYAYDNGIAEVRGGLISGIYGVFGSGKIYLYGSNFSINGQDLNYGDSLRDYVSLSPTYPEYYIGTITGTLQNGSAVNNDFWIWASTDADIIVVPEPCTLLLLGIGAAIVRKRHR
ncbi:MAG: PEP-CTERM sorting domain-containing protein [Sedimentisphaerales bacterium]|jgi:hypothetical protein